MQVQNIECQITAVLTKRYLEGEQLPAELQANMETHLKVCPECHARVSGEQESLVTMLDSAAETAAVLSRASRGGEGITASTPAAALSQALKSTVRSSPPGWAAFKNPKVLALSFALAVVMIAMTTIMRNPTALLGSKADETLKASPENAEDKPVDEGNSEDATENAATGDKSEEDPNSEDVPTADPAHTEPEATDTQTTQSIEKPAIENDPRVPGKPTLDTSDLIVAGGKAPAKKDPPPTQKPVSSTPKQPAKKPATIPAKKKSAPTKPKSTSGVKVYDSNGKPINP